MFDLRSLNLRQKEAVETLAGPLLILAGAGTGKTRVITCRIANLIRSGVPPASILAVTFTNKAAREMQERARQLIGAASAKPTQPRERPVISTFHALGLRILHQHGAILGYKPNFVIYGEAEQLSLVRKILSHISQAEPRADPGAVLACLSKIRNGAPASDRSGADCRAMAQHIRGRYEKALRGANAVDFDDLILLPLELLSGHPEIVKQYHARFRHVMVDEYQDTNFAQFRLLQFLTGPEQNLCVVGDDDQSIYAWRGAEVANLLNLERHYPRVRIIKLEQNYRSTTTILDAANALIKNNPKRHLKKLWSNAGPGSMIALHVFSSEEEEAERLVEQVGFERLQARGTWAEFAILFRTNQQSRALETSFRKAGIPYRLIGGQSYFDRREVKDLLAYLKLFLNPADEISFQRIANVPARGLSDLTIEKLLGMSHPLGVSVFQAMQQPSVLARFPPKTRESIGLFVALIDKYRGQLPSMPAANLSAWAREWVKETGYFDYLRRSPEAGAAVENRIQNLEQFISTFSLEGHSCPNAETRLQSFLEQLALEEDREEKEASDSDAVFLITIHSCKGLEFNHVYIAGLEDGVLPHARSKEEGTLDEERRLFYVAITRARKTLTMSYCTGRKKYGEMVPCHPSPFLKELPPELIEVGEARAAKIVSVETGKNYFAGLRASLGG